MGSAASDTIASLSQTIEEDFARQRRLLSFDEYLELVTENPARYCRDAGGYTRDMVEFFGRREVRALGGMTTRFKLFDQEFLPEPDREALALLGHERVQWEIHRALSNFVRVGSPNRVIMLHGPNGSAKSTIAACLMRGLENYSRQDEGALYRYHWVFPRRNSIKGNIGFGGGPPPSDRVGSYAHLDDDEIEARVLVEVRDHPLFLIPPAQRRQLLTRLLGEETQIPRWLTDGTLCHKSQQIFEALLASYGGQLKDVLRHVRVERFFMSRRYRRGVVTLGPELSVDAKERQVTADQNLGALPPSLHGLSLYEVSGELVDASGGMLELSDLLKRPLDAFKYLQITAESGEVALGSQTLQVNSVLLASANELHLSAFREHPEFASFRGRLDMIRVPYLLDHREELAIYERQVASQVARHVAPHAVELAARFAVLTRLEKPDPDPFEMPTKDAIRGLSAWQKMELYAGESAGGIGKGGEAAVRAVADRMMREWETKQDYEGGQGASPRVMRTVLLDAAQHRDFDYLSPFAVLEELEELCQRKEDFAFLRREPQPGGFHDFASFPSLLRTWLLDRIEAEMSEASGLVEERSYEDLLARYIDHLSAWLKGEKLRDTVTGEFRAPDESLMSEVEQLLGSGDASAEDRRRVREELMSRMAAWAIDHPEVPLRQSRVVAELLTAIRRSVFEERKHAVADFCHALVEGRPKPGSSETDLPAAERRLGKLGYSEQSAKDAAARLLAERYAQLGL